MAQQSGKPKTRQDVFVEEYLLDLNGTQAAIRAGYSPKSASEQASRLLTKDKVRARIDKAMADRSVRTGVNADRVVAELAKIAFVNAADVMNFDSGEIKKEASREDTAAISSVKVKTIPTGYGDNGVEREIRMGDKAKALELLGKHVGLWNDKAELTVPVQVVVQYDYGDDGDGGPTE